MESKEDDKDLDLGKGLKTRIQVDFIELKTNRRDGPDT